MTVLNSGVSTATPPKSIALTGTLVMVMVTGLGPLEVYVTPGATPVSAFTKMLEPMPGPPRSLAPVPKSNT